MQILRQENGNFVISGLESPILEMILAIPDATSPQGDIGAEQRLYPDPSNEGGLNEEWREYVRPGLEEWFKSATDTVKQDLQQLVLTDNGDEPSLTITAENVDLWLNALNQARLMLASRHGFTEEDLEQAPDGDLSSPRGVALFQVYFYGVLQDFLLRGQ